MKKTIIFVGKKCTNFCKILYLSIFEKKNTNQFLKKLSLPIFEKKLYTNFWEKIIYQFLKKLYTKFWKKIYTHQFLKKNYMNFWKYLYQFLIKTILPIFNFDKTYLFTQIIVRTSDLSGQFVSNIMESFFLICC